MECCGNFEGKISNYFYKFLEHSFIKVLHYKESSASTLLNFSWRLGGHLPAKLGLGLRAALKENAVSAFNTISAKSSGRIALEDSIYGTSKSKESRQDDKDLTSQSCDRNDSMDESH
ncbi:hypothetical protein FH972_010023 [Carpinus fangiana]|uniref:Uncharacterized protein n=1 Tax=Carpinus fangiana TaxID=176857 RepID=A0A660KTZ6_9ROSI|nr:hypothetical protein FH972_010023 [Carpinus fangiana]